MKNLTLLAVMVTALASTAVPAAANVNSCTKERDCLEFLWIEVACTTRSVCTSK